jgi:adenylosuccinate synthase
MDISLNPTLERIDNNLRIIGGSLIASNSTKLRSIGEGLIVDEDCLLDGCSELAYLGPNIKVGRDLDLSRCSHVVLSAHVTVGRNLLLPSGYELSLLPADLAVGGKLIRS